MDWSDYNWVKSEGNARHRANTDLQVHTVQSSCVAKQNLPVIWFIIDDVYPPPAFIYMFGVHATNPKRINDGGGMWLQYLFCTRVRIHFQGKRGRLGFSLWDTHYHSVWHTFTLAATVVAKQRTQLRTLKLHTGKIGPRGGGWLGLMSDFKRH